MSYEDIARAKARCEEQLARVIAELFAESAEFFLYVLKPPGERKFHAERSLWSSNPKFRLLCALGLAIETYERVM
jgi:hypothetical protein